MCRTRRFFLVEQTVASYGSSAEVADDCMKDIYIYVVFVRWTRVLVNFIVLTSERPGRICKLERL